MELLEREVHLDALCERLKFAVAGRGGLVFLEGEAGAGKTALVRHFLQTAGIEEQALVGACDAMGTPRALAPLLDVARGLGSELEALLASNASAGEVFSCVLAGLGLGRRVDVVVFEDVHWADDATLDLLRFLGRRLGGRRALLVATYRDDGARAGTSLRILVGDLATMSCVHRLKVPPLSASAVRRLCGEAAVDPHELHRLTGGNAFFVTEVLRAPEERVPATIRDFVLARALRLSGPAQAALEAAAAIGVTIEPALLAEVVGDRSIAVAECLDAGLLVDAGESLAFRHELVRLAIEEATPRVRRGPLHAAILALLRRGAIGRDDLPRLVRHAEAAGDAAAVCEFAPAAAERAGGLLAHREAAAHYRAALRFVVTVPAASRAILLECFAHECYLSAQLTAALKARSEAAVLWQQIGDRLRSGENLAWASRLTHLCGRPVEASRLAAQAIQILEQLIPGAELAMAYNNAAWVRMLGCDLEAAIRLAHRAERLAHSLGETEIAAHAGITLGASKLQSGDDGGRLRLEAAFEAACDDRREEPAGRAIWNLALLSLWQRRYGLAEHYLDDGDAYCLQHGLESWRLLLLAARSRWLLETGKWTEAEQAAIEVLRPPDPILLRRTMALTVLGRLHARRGQVGAQGFLDEALRLGGERQWIGPFAPLRPARAEAAWLAGDNDAAAAEAAAGLEDAERTGDRWQVGELAFWALRAGRPAKLIGLPAEPYGLAVAGNWAAAAREWQRLGSPYEMAQSLALADDEAALLEALQVFDSLGAAPDAAAVRRRLRELGTAIIPRGPRAATRENPAGLTPRESEVLALLASGLANTDIARRLFLSKKTVEHHVSAVLRKLSAGCRSDAVQEARRLGLVPEMGATRPQVEGHSPMR